MNNSSIQKGLFRAQALKKYFETVKRNSQSVQSGIFIKPDENRVDGMKNANYNKLSDKGYPKLETVINDNDVIIGLVSPKPNVAENEKPEKDNSTVYKSVIPGAIDKVIVGENVEGYPFMKIRIRSERIPGIGDKFSSRAGQKGTVGYKPHRSDMPFTESGLQPDAIINPNCIPKRMTIGQLIECLLGKVCAIKGVYGDATPFLGIDLKKINKELVEKGYEEWGNETMYNGMTGQKMKNKIFIGPTYYQRLKQMAGDKVHSRAGGPKQLLTRQATEGRSRGGGLRVGEMERDGLCAHGTARMLKERLVDSADSYTCHVCDICGLLAHKSPGNNYYICKPDNNTTKISTIVIPYACKLLLQELASMQILGRIRTSKNLQR